MVTKTCKVCGETKEAVRGTWPQLHGLPYGKTCCVCVAEDYRQRRADPIRGAKIRESTRVGNTKYNSNPDNKAKVNAKNVEYQRVLRSTDAGRAKSNAVSRKYRATNTGKAATKAHYQKISATPDGKAKLRAISLARYYADPNGKAKNRESSATWKKENAGKVNAFSAKRRPFKLHRTPAWLTTADLEDIRDKYVVAQWFSYLAMIPYHVDHILPLQGELVSGLHVPSNLCIRLGAENIQKSNKWAP